MALHRVAFIGCGRRARQHLIGIQADPRCQVVALADLKRDVADAFNADAKLNAAVYTDHMEMLAREKPDVICTALWTPLHLPIIRDCASAGVKSILCEKPIAPSWGECLQVDQIAKQTHCRINFCHQRRFAAGNRAVRQLLHENRLGKILRLDLYANKNLLDCGTHTLDQALSFMNEPDADWVLAAVDSSKLVQWFNTPAEDQALGIIAFHNGVRAFLSVGAPDQESDMLLGVRIHGSDGFLEVGWDGEIKRHALYNDPAWKFPVPPVDLNAQIVATVRHVIDCLESGAESELSHHHAMRAEQIIFAMYQSARLRRRIELPLHMNDNAFHTMLQNHEITPATPAK